MRASSRPPSPRLLVLAFVAVGLAFVLATGVTEYRAGVITSYSRQITGNAAPSIEHLASARVILRELVAAVDSWIYRSDDVEALDHVLDRKTELDRTIAKYTPLTPFPEEGAVWRASAASLRDVEEDLTRFLDRARSGEPLTRRSPEYRRLVGDVEKASEALLRNVEVNARESSDLAEKIEDAHRSSMAIAFALDALCFLLAIAAGMLASRASARYAKLLREHNELVERRAQELDLFAGRVAHDILSPLSTVGLALESVSISRGGDEVLQDDLGRARGAMERIRLIVHGLLEFARSGAKPAGSTRTPVQPLLEDIRREFSPKAGKAEIDLRIHPCPEAAVAASPGVLASLLTNLVGNAIKYMGDAPARGVDVRVTARQERVRFEVEDTGPGIPADLGPRIFDLHVRGTGTDKAGFGLGLATVKRLVEGHGGSVGMHPAAGRGSLFWFDLPRVPLEAGEMRAAPAGDGSRAGNASSPEGPDRKNP